MAMDITLNKLITEGATLTEEQKQSLYDLVAKGCRKVTKTKLASKIWNVPLSCWENFSRYDRIYWEHDRFSYCAGQSYPDEIVDVRDLMLGRK